MISQLDRTRTELLANRRRLRREGVALMSGDRHARALLPIESLREIYVRPAYRGTGPKPSMVEEFLAGFFDLRIFPWTLGGALLLIAILVLQHFHS